MTSKNREPPKRRVVYCLIPRDLARRVHDLLREFYADDPSIRVVVDMRRRERRRTSRRRAGGRPPAGERRTIRGAEGRRVADRRAPTVAVEPPALPKKARRYADRLSFVERVEPSEQQLQDVESARLVLRFQAGDDSAMTELYMCYFDSVYGYAHLALRDPHEAEDITQQVFTKVFQALPRYEYRRKPFRAWLFRIARNAVLDALRRRQRLTLEEPAQIDLRRDAALSEEARSALNWLSDGDVSIFVERLPTAQREVIILRFMLGLSTGEIVQVMSRSPKAVRQLQSRALRTLEERLTEVARGRRRRRRTSMLVRLRPAPVLAARRFALRGADHRRR